MKHFDNCGRHRWKPDSYSWLRYVLISTRLLMEPAQAETHPVHLSWRKWLFICKSRRRWQGCHVSNEEVHALISDLVLITQQAPAHSSFKGTPWDASKWYARGDEYACDASIPQHSAANNETSSGGKRRIIAHFRDGFWRCDALENPKLHLWGCGEWVPGEVFWLFLLWFCSAEAGWKIQMHAGGDVREQNRGHGFGGHCRSDSEKERK